MSNTYTIFDAGGVAIRTVMCPDDELHRQLGGGETARAGDLLPAPELPPSPQLPAYVAGRLSAYPRVEQQLDWLWHAMHDGTMPKAEPFYSAILRVKEEFPKG